VTNREKTVMIENMQKDGKASLKTKIAQIKQIPTEKELTNLLNESTLVVTFKKLDGDERKMTCTRSFDVIPEEMKPKTNKESKQGTITVWDINARGWRSFKYDRVTKVTSNEV